MLIEEIFIGTPGGGPHIGIESLYISLVSLKSKNSHDLKIRDICEAIVMWKKCLLFSRIIIKGGDPIQLSKITKLCRALRKNNKDIDIEIETPGYLPTRIEKMRSEGYADWFVVIPNTPGLPEVEHSILLVDEVRFSEKKLINNYSAVLARTAAKKFVLPAHDVEEEFQKAIEFATTNSNKNWFYSNNHINRHTEFDLSFLKKQKEKKNEKTVS